MTTNAVCTWDWTIPAESTSVEKLKQLLEEHAKAWCFQEEEGEETGYDHFQGRMSLKLKARLAQVRNLFVLKEMPEVHLSPTSNANRDNCFYVMKEEGRLNGPWKDTDEKPIEVPPDLKDIVLRPWQQAVVDSVGKDNDRVINVIADKDGNIGKSVLMRYMGVHRLARKIPATIEKAEDMMQWVMSFPASKCYMVDMPRAMDQVKVAPLYVALEEVKNGYAYDKRYHGKEMWFPKPSVWVFTNTMPDSKFLSFDKWKLWEVKNNQLVEAPRSANNGGSARALAV